MASRVRIVAAACVVASALFVGGGGAAMAFADPQPMTNGDGPGSQASDEVETGSTPSPGGVLDETPGGAPTTPGRSLAGGAPGAPKPAPKIGDDRNGLTSRGAGTRSGDPSASKQSRVDRGLPPQTPPGAAGEPDPPGPPDLKPTQPTAPGSPAATEYPKYPREPKDPEGPDYPTEHQPGSGWPWWGPCPEDPDEPDGPDDPDGPGLPPGGGNGNGGGGTRPEPPTGRPNLPPAMQLPLPREVPPELPNVSADPVVDAGLAAGAVELPLAPITLPAVVAPLGAGGAGGVGGGGSGGPRAGTPSDPKGPGAAQNNQPPSRTDQPNSPTFTASNGAPAESFRVGYGNYLRTAGVGTMMAVAIPGVAGILLLTGAGGLLGYRQARAGRTIRARGTERFVG